MDFKNKNSKLSTKEIYIYKIQQTRPSYHKLYGVNILKRYSNQLQNVGIKIIHLNIFLKFS